MIVTLAKKREIRAQIFYKGRQNDLRRFDDRIAQSVFGVSKSHISFIKQTHRDVDHYKEALDDARAANMSLSICIGYLQDHNDDQLFGEYWKQYTRVVQSGDPDAITRCKEILQFVKYPEGKELPYELYNWAELHQMCFYNFIEDYPSDYIMKYDIINEFDLKLTLEDKKKELRDYALNYLAEEPYKHAPNLKLVGKLKPAIQNISDHMPKHVARMVKEAIAEHKYPVNRLGVVGNSYCKLGSKRHDFWATLWTRGIHPDIVKYVQRDIDTINQLYGLSLQLPPIKEDGIRMDYFMHLIIREDPKKPRDAYQSNPLQDYIGYPGMDVLALIMKHCPWIYVSRRRDDVDDMINDKSRHTEISRVYYENLAQHTYAVSTDLSKATEHLDIIDSIAIIEQLLVTITGLDYNRVHEWCVLTFAQLGRSPIVLDYGMIDCLLYSRKGQTQGVPGSFHAMTIVLAIINLQATLDAGYEYDVAIKLIMNNGDDGVTPETAIPRYKKLLEEFVGPDVFNQEKSFSSRINGSLEFCKTIFYANNVDLIVGHRYSTIYKILMAPSSLIHLLSGGFEHDCTLVKNTCRIFEDYLNEDVDDLATRISVVAMKDPGLLTRIIQVDEICTVIALHQMVLEAKPSKDITLVSITPESWWALLPTLGVAYVEGNNLSYADLKILRQYKMQLPSSVMPDRNILYLMDDEKWAAQYQKWQAQYGTLSGYRVKEVSNGFELQEERVVINTPPLLQIQLGLTEGSKILLKERIGTDYTVTITNDGIDCQLSDFAIQECNNLVQSIGDRSHIQVDRTAMRYRCEDIIPTSQKIQTLLNNQVEVHEGTIKRTGNTWGGHTK